MTTISSVTSPINTSTGMDRNTGKLITGIDDIAQSIGDILTTPIGTRVMRRDYGSLLFELLDAPLNVATRLLCISAIAMAIARWEPRFLVKQVLFAPGTIGGDFSDGQATLSVIGSLTNQPPNNALTTLSIPLT